MKKQSGFTLIELMIVVAIVAILAAIALPAYQSYTKKARFTEVVSATGPYKTAIEICIQTGTALASCTKATHGIPDDITAGTGQVASVTWVAATPLLTATGNATTFGNTMTYTLTPTVQADGKITWAAGGTCAANALC